MSAVPQIPEPPFEVADDPDVAVTVEFLGERFAVRETVSLLPLMQFAVIARQQEQTKRHRRTPLTPAEAGAMEMEALAALFDLLKQCIAEEEWFEFYEHAVARGAGPAELMPLVRDAITARAARPTRQPSPSPDGPPPTAPSSAAGSSSPGWSTPQGSVEVQRTLEASGRPDLALVVKRARLASRN